MQDAMLTYFDGEKNAALLLVGLAGIGLVAATIFFQPRWGLRPFALTLAVFAVLELALGIGLYLRTGPQVNGLVAQLTSDTASFVSEEGARMARVQRTFVLVQYIELALIVVAAITALAAKQRVGLSGVALGLLLNAAALLAFDLVAERRGAQYLAAIDQR